MTSVSVSVSTGVCLCQCLPVCCLFLIFLFFHCSIFFIFLKKNTVYNFVSLHPSELLAPFLFEVLLSTCGVALLSPPLSEVLFFTSPFGCCCFLLLLRGAASPSSLWMVLLLPSSLRVLLLSPFPKLGGAAFSLRPGG